jgi:hypothetical protein
LVAVVLASGKPINPGSAMVRSLPNTFCVKSEHLDAEGGRRAFQRQLRVSGGAGWVPVQICI